MNNLIVLKQIVLDAKHTPTGKTKHSSGNEELPPAAMLQIVKYEDVEGFYLLYLDADGNELTDTFHDTLERAFAQAEWEYRVKPNEWETVNSG
jgi:hypothetical protein